MLPRPSGPATSLSELYLTLRPDPLIDPAEFRQYYRGEVNEVRGEDTVARLSLKLQQAFRAIPFKAFLMGHPGVGKSTEISRLLTRIQDQHLGVRLSVATELNPASFKVFDVLVLMLARLAEEVSRIDAAPAFPATWSRISSDGLESSRSSERSLARWRLAWRPAQALKATLYGPACWDFSRRPSRK